MVVAEASDIVDYILRWRDDISNSAGDEMQCPDKLQELGTQEVHYSQSSMDGNVNHLSIPA